MSARLVGMRVPRREDPALLRGAGRFVDDIRRPEMLHAAFLRSPFAHAAFTHIERDAARALPGVHAVLTLDDLRPHLAMERLPVHMPAGGIRFVAEPWVLARDEVSHVGEAVAVVLADSRHVAEDALALIEVDWQPLPVVADPRAALAPDAPKVRREVPDNLVARIAADYGDCDTAFRTAAHVLPLRLRQHKGLGQSIECRGVAASYDDVDDRITVWDGTQMPHRAQGVLCRVLGLSERQVRVVPPDVGGGFGPKFVTYPEEAVVALAARLFRRPVKWIEDRREHFTTTTQERDQFWEIEVAADAGGRLLGIRGRVIHDHGAFTPYGIAVPQNAINNLIGAYRLPNLRLEVLAAMTNMVAVAPTRGAGRPQATYAMERALDAIAHAMGLDRAEVRRRNMIGPDEMPYATPLVNRDGVGMVYDTGDYPECQRRALARAGYEDFPARQAAARAAGRYLGLGIANYVEGTGRGPFESATVRVGPSGKVMVETGATAQGQGVATMLAQLAAEALGVEMADVSVGMGDTAAIALGVGAFASRQAVTAGSSTQRAAFAVREKALKAASEILEAAEVDLDIAQGRVFVKGVPERAVTLGEIAQKLAGMPGFAIPGGLPPGLEAREAFESDGLTYANGCHVAEVEVDPETGHVAILRYIVVHDSGRLINPMIVDGQIQGGVAHGIGTALFERMLYDENGQPLTANLGEYLLATAPELPNVEIEHMESPTPRNPLGAKGAGESGTMAASAVIASAVENALSPFDIRIAESPILPERIVALIAAARGPFVS